MQNKSRSELNEFGRLSYSKAFMAAFRNFERDFSQLRLFVEACPDGSIVEMGAGFGRLLPLLSERSSFLVENDFDMLKILQAEVAKHNLATILECSAHRVELEQGSVSGVIFAANSLAEMQPIVFALAEASRILKDGGLLDIAIQNPEFQGEAPASFRLVESEEGVFTSHIDTFSTGIFGPFCFQTQLLTRNKDVEKKFYICQTFPNLDYWVDLLPRLNLQIETCSTNWSEDKFNRESSFVLNIRAKKISLAAPIVYQPNLLQVYEKMAGKYDEIVNSSNYAVPAWIAATTKPFKGMSLNLLDLGCGNGWLPELLSANEIYTNAYGIDFSPSMLEECRKRKTYHGLLVADLVLPLPIVEYNIFDLVSVFGLMEFLPEPMAKINEVHRVLRSGGSAYFSFEETQAHSQPSGRPQSGLEIVKFHYSKEEIENIFKASKLRLKKIESIFGYISPSSKEAVHYLMVHAEKVS